MQTAILLCAVLFQPLPIAPSPQLKVEKDHHNHTAITKLETTIPVLEARLSRDEDRIERLQSELQQSSAGMTGVELRGLQSAVEKHNTYFALLTAFTGIIAAAVVESVIKRMIESRKTI